MAFTGDLQHGVNSGRTMLIVCVKLVLLILYASGQVVHESDDTRPEVERISEKVEPLSYVLYEGSQSGVGSSHPDPGSTTETSSQDAGQVNAQQDGRERQGSPYDIHGQRGGPAQDTIYRQNPSQHSGVGVNPTNTRPNPAFIDPYSANVRSNPGNIDPYSTNSRPNPGYTDPYSSNARPNPGYQQGGQPQPGSQEQQVLSNYVPGRSYITSESTCTSDPYRILINGMECSRAVDTLGAFVCYNYERTSQECCQKCLSVKRPQQVGCEYGDRSYQCRNIEPFDCYAQRNREICCETCQRLRQQHDTGAAGCQYGDLTPRCQLVQHKRHLCYLPENQRLCCKTCPRLATVPHSECRWGNQNPDLCEPFDATRQLRINCYNSSVRTVCCDTCRRLKERIRERIPGCEYGDKPVSFSTARGILSCGEYIREYGVADCQNPRVTTYCCHTCYRHNRG